jgi:hypothetical protein
MLGDTVPIIRLEEAPNNICIVPIRPYFGLRDIRREVLLWPEDIGRR